MLFVLVVYLVVSLVRVVYAVTVALPNAVVMFVFLDLIFLLVLVGALGLFWLFEDVSVVSLGLIFGVFLFLDVCL
jgi:hypothetical protein